MKYPSFLQANMLISYQHISVQHGSIDEFINLKQQAKYVLQFAIAVLTSKQRGNPEPMIDLFKSDDSGQLRYFLRCLNVISKEEFTIEQLVQSICDDYNPEASDKEIVFEEVTVQVQPDENSDMKPDHKFSNSLEKPEQDSESDEPLIKKKRRVKQVFQKDGQKFKLCPLDGCNEQYLVGNRTSYLQHEKQFHRYGCDVCGRILASRTSFRNHVLLHDGDEAKVRCDFCVRTFTTKGSMMVHIREVHNNTGVHFNCQYCKKGFMEQKDLFAHLHDHRVCKLCDETFPDLSGWISHTRKRHPESLFTCDSCDHTSLSRALLDRHKRMRHSESNQKQKPQRFTVFAINSASFHQCPQCSLQFINEEFLLQHNDQAHNRSQLDKQDRSMMLRRSKEEREKFALRYSCDVCGKKYRFKNSLWSHRHKEHSLNQKTAICDVCGQNFKHHSYLTAHIANKHATEFPFRCEACPKVYSQAYLLKEHAKSHDNQKRHKCPHCDYRAKQSYILKEHVIRMHSAERPVKCSECAKAFLNNSELKRHMLKHRNNQGVQCEECDQMFRRKVDLRWHRTRAHKEDVIQNQKL